MTLVLRGLASMFALLLSGVFVSAQVQTGTPPFGSFGGGPDIVNLGNLNVHIDIPVLQRDGRGTNFTYDLSYDTSVWYPSTVSGTSTWTPAYNWGWRAVTEASTGYISYSQTTTPWCKLGNNYAGQQTTYSNWVYHDPWGVPHSFANLATYYYQGPPAECSGADMYTSGSGVSDGYTLSLYGYVVNSLVGVNGQKIAAPVNVGTGSGGYTDRNGNEIGVNGSGQFYDTLSSSAAVLSVTGSGTSTSPMKFTYTAPSGALPYYEVNYTNYTVATNFGVSGINEYKSTAAVPLVSSIVLPDSSQYTFIYETTPGSCTPYSGTTCVTGRLTKVTLPTGGTIAYAYTGGNNGIFSDGSAATLTRTTPDGIWTYAQAKLTNPETTTTITDPSGNQTSMEFQYFYEVSRQIYQNSMTTGQLLEVITTLYNSEPLGTLTFPITEKIVANQYGSSGSQAVHSFLYNSYGLMTQEYDWDYPTAGTLIRHVLVTYASLGNGILGMPASVTICSGSGTSSSCGGTGTLVAQTTYSYDQGSVSTSSGTPQHAGVTGSRGNLTTMSSYVSSSTSLTQGFTYWDTGMVNTATDVNNGVTSYSYPNATSTCGNAFPTGMTEAISTLTRSYTWNCTGGVQLTATDENSQVTTYTYNDPYFWRPASAADQENNVTSLGYAINPMGGWQSLLFNSNLSVANTGQGLDGLGRLIVVNHMQAPFGTAWDQVTQSYDSNGRLWKTSAPCVTTGPWTCPITGQTTTYDALNRIAQTADAGGGTTTYSYNQNDVLVTVGPTPSGAENTKRRQLEYDALGRLTSVCEVTTLTGSGTCGQNTTQTGYWTKYTYDALGDLLTVTQNAQASSGNQQARTYAYDAMSRLTSETNPESGTITYGYDSATGTLCITNSPGDLIKRVDANGNWTCANYDAMHRVTDVGNNNQNAANPCKRFRYDNTTGVLGSIPSGVSVSNKLGNLVEAETDTCAWPITQSSIVTDEWFSYTARGETSDTYQATPHSGGYYHSWQTYWANGVPSSLGTNIAGLPWFSFGPDGEGRINTVTASSGQNPVTATSFGMYSSPYQLAVTFGSGDSDTFTYDPNTFRLNKYQFKVGSQTVTGTLGWNANWSLGSLGISDPFSTANTQSCSFTADDLSRISQSSCGTIWGQNFTYDPFGNITKNKIAGTGATSFTPTYQSSPLITNRVSSVGGVSATYDANGNSLNDTFRTFTWNANSNLITIGSVSLTYDAFDRMVEQSVSASNSQIVYSPAGVKLALMNGTALTKAFVPLPGGAAAVYNSSGLAYYRHTDHLGSSRFASTPSQTLYSDTAYSPFGEPYASSGAIDNSFTDQNQDTTVGLYDFLYREHDPNQGRWTSPDPAGLTAADPGYPQSWNRYGYVLNSPLNIIDPFGLFGSVPPGCTVSYPVEGGPGEIICGMSQPWLFDPNFACDFFGHCGGGGGNPNAPATIRVTSWAPLPPSGGTTIGPQTDWFFTKQWDCLVVGAKGTVGGFVMKKEIDALGDWLMGGSADSTVPQMVTGSTVSFPLHVALDEVAGSPNNRPVVQIVRTALREQGYKVSGNTIAKVSKFLGKAAFVVHVGFAFNDGREDYHACMEN